MSVLSCLGIWDCMTSQEVVTFVRKGIAEGTPLDTLCEQTMDHCLASDSGMTGVGCDNMTMVIVAILHGKTLEEWYDHITQKVAIRLGPADSKARLNGDEDPEALEEKAVAVVEEVEKSTTPEEAVEEKKEHIAEEQKIETKDDAEDA